MARIQEKVTSDGRTRYYVTIRLKGVPTKSGVFDRKTDARRWASATEADIRRGRYFDDAESSKHTMADTISRYVTEVLPRKSASNRPIEGWRLRWWKEQIGGYTLKNVTPQLLCSYREKLRGMGRSEATVKRFLRNLGHVFTLAMEWHWIKESPMRQVKMPKEPGGRVRFLELDELERFLAVCKDLNNPLLYPAVVLSLATGVRKGELRGLTWDRLRLDQGLILLDVTKNSPQR